MGQDSKNKKEENLERLNSRMTLPLISAPMFLISDANLVLSACREGIVGSIPALNYRTSEQFGLWLGKMNRTLLTWRSDEPERKIADYAVNLVVNKNMNARLEDDLSLCEKHKVPIIITSLGAVPEVVERVHAYGGLVFHDVTNVVHAKKAAKAGVDGIIAVAAGAGGKSGTLSPFPLMRDIRNVFNGIVILAGALTEGNDILAAQTLGADFSYMGTRFIATQEASADPDYKQMILSSEPNDIIYTTVVTGVVGNYLKNSMQKAGFTVSEKHDGSAPAQAALKTFDKLLESVAKQTEKVGIFIPGHGNTRHWRKDVWSAGHGVGNIHDVPTVEALIGRLTHEYKAAQKRQLEAITAGPFPLLPQPPNPS